MSFETFLIVEICLMAIFALGYLFTKVQHNRRVDGTLFVNGKDPNKDVFRMEFNGSLADLATKASVTFEVKRED